MPTTARGRLRPTLPWSTAPVLSDTPTLSEPTPSPMPELLTPSPTLPSASPTPPTLASALTTSEPLCRAAGRGRLMPTLPLSTLVSVPCHTPTESSPTPASTAPTPSTPSPTLPPDSPTHPTSASAPTMLEPSSLANCLTQSAQE